ncbi:MAG: DUF1800 domain-containing protein [Gemmatimonadaceae bacterium]|nr:DUF1800 domain-containing protein [Gemmatimonadaceae bacterium]
MPTLPDADLPDHEVVVDESEPVAPSRRRFFAMGASAVATLAASAAIDAQTGRPRGKPVAKPLPVGAKPNASADWKDPVLRLVRRITMGLEPGEVALARQKGFAGYLNYQLNFSAIDDSAVDALVAARFPLLSQTSAQLKTADGGEVYNQLADAAVFRAMFSKRQLKERMVEFWTDHFNSLYDKIGYLKAADDRTVIRQHALGKFPDMLRASAESAAMLGYLDQASSRKPTPNQNYAREIMELHTLGVDGGYTQNDVAQLSRILTGWSYDGNGVFAFNRSFHDFTAKTFLGVDFPAMPSNATAAQFKSEGDLAITMLVNHPNTARYIATKMARWLLAHEPSAAVVDATAAAYLATGGDIKAMIRTILTGTNLMASPAKYKRPFHLMVSSLRAMAIEVTNIRSTRQRLDAMDMSPFYWEQPDGYPDRISWWSGLTSQRWNWANYISTQNSATNVRLNSTAIFRTPQDTADGVVNQIAVRLFGNEMPASLKTSLLAYLRGGTYTDTRVRETIALAASSHQFQWY